MGKPTGFMEFSRVEAGHRPVNERVHDYFEIDVPLPEATMLEQAARCMDCGIPFCHGPYGCPVKNRIPEFNDLVYRGHWKTAVENLHSTNNFPEVTGRVCPAPCEAACTLNIRERPVTIKHIEYQIVERAFAEGWIRPMPASRKTGKRVAIVGSGPAGLAAAQQLARLGHEVVVFEKDDRIGGLLRYGIPDFKLEKHIIDRRLEQMRTEGVSFETGVLVGEDISARYLRKSFDAILLAMGAGQPRPLTAEGMDTGFRNVHYALEFLSQQNRVLAGDKISDEQRISAKDKHVVVIGGGDTGSDCIGTSIRHGARRVTQIEILPQPPERRDPGTPWPLWPKMMRTSSSQEEGCTRRWSVLTKQIRGNNGKVHELCCCEVDWTSGAAGWQMKERPGSDFVLQADLVLLAMGFVHVVHQGLVDQLGLKLDARGNVQVQDYMSSEVGIFATGDTVLGASLVVRAIDAGREAAAEIDRWLASR